MGAGLGKVERDFLKSIVLKNTGAPSGATIVGPGLGLDNAVVSLGGGRVMVVTADPLTIIPSIGMEDSAWLTIHELASDLTTSAVTPQYAVLDYNLPPALEKEDFAAYVRAMSRECRRLGITIVGGHTGKYPGCDFTIVGGGTLMGMADESAYVTPRMLLEGDDVLLTKGAAIETTAVLSLAFSETVERELGGRLAKRAREYLRKCSTVDDALAAASVGIRRDGVTSMHDATEGGVLGALYELSRAGAATLEIERESIFVSEVSRSVCGLFGLDPLATLSEGSLIITCRSERSEEVIRRLRRGGNEAFSIGTVSKKGRPGLFVSQEGRRARYVPPEFDPYWDVYAKASREGWR